MNKSNPTKTSFDPVAAEYARRAETRSIPRNDRSTLEIVMNKAQMINKPIGKAKKAGAKS